MKCLDQQGLKYLWSLIKDKFAESTEVQMAIDEILGRISNVDNTADKDKEVKSAEKLSNTSAIGSATKPVYFNSSGVPVAGTYTLGSACAKGVSTSVTSGDSNLVTGDAVSKAISTAANYEEGTWTPTCAILSGIDSYEAIYVKIGNIVYCNFTLEGRRTKEKKLFRLGGLPYFTHTGVNNIPIGTMHCATGTSQTDSKSGFIDSAGTENEQIVDVYLDGQTAIRGLFRKKTINCYLPGYNSNSAVTIEGTFIYRTTGTKNS